MEPNGKESFQELRGKTDKSLEDERDKTDDYLARKIKKVEEKTSEKVRSIRLAIDHALETQREEVGLGKECHREVPDMPPSQVDNELLVQEREQFDKAKAVEREAEDRAREEERVQKQLIAHTLLEQERKKTDSNLLDERVNADLELITREQFLAIVSHDLKNPLAAISITARVMRRSLTKGETGSLLDNLGLIEQSAASMSRMISDLLDVERMAQGKLTLHPEKVDLRALLQECGELFAPLVSAQAFSMTIDTGPDPIFTDLDHDRILQVLSNLIGNSLKFTPNGGAIEVSARKQETQVEISVTDNGPGIPAPAQAYIFDRFAQLNVADHQGLGLGLGLFIAKWIVEAHKGRMWVTSMPGKGCTFSFTLPLSL